MKFQIMNVIAASVALLPIAPAVAIGIRSGNLALLVEKSEGGNDLSPENFVGFTFEDADEGEDDDFVTCIQSCERQYEIDNDSKGYNSCVYSCEDITELDYYSEKTNDLSPEDFVGFTFEDVDEEKDDAATKRCIQRCGRRNTRNTRAYSLCEDSCRGITGSDYCTYAPDYNCYSAGWPDCCTRNGGADCPVNKPSCNVKRSVGRSYCTYSPDYTCYKNGWPKCCLSNNGANCPTTQPSCDIMGADYCTYSPDYKCYTNGWPNCCSKNNGASCPVEQPPCHIKSEESFASV
ncbi:hypothetical protein HJC23_012595 [Cyclotella cryptica]|uniref:Uncharacterized protein n=1 Tax=Cyclotella cryptica TaxID=29204 RepID=A0ABD3NXK8_9STRA|eukprot:CCRYP_019239-RA/>CCRYP_019239-RA protein AED:0.03 eAED:0.03 QI:325/1/1/1/1/1/2/450/290